MWRTRIGWLAVVLTALALVPAGAHLFELPNKMELTRDDYFVVQGIYRGWSLFGLVLIPTVLVNGALAVLLRGSGAAFRLALTAAAGMAATLVIFFVWTYPANQATANWTFAPAAWQELRWQWECAHAVNAAITFVALCSVTAALLRMRTGEDERAS